MGGFFRPETATHCCSFVAANGEARALQVKANNIMNALCDVGLIAGIKYVLTTMGISAGEPRRPFRPLDAEQKRRIDLVLRDDLVT